MIAVLVDFEVAPDKVDAFLVLMRQQAENSVSKEADCVQFDVCTDPASPNSVFLYEVYTNRAAFDVHLASDHFKSFDAEVASMVTGKVVRILDDVFRPEIGA